MIKLAIDHYSGQMSEVARRLGIGRSTLYRKLKEYGIDPETEAFALVDKNAVLIRLEGLAATDSRRI